MRHESATVQAEKRIASAMGNQKKQHYQLKPVAIWLKYFAASHFDRLQEPAAAALHSQHL
jgi:hypothetical protein